MEQADDIHRRSGLRQTSLLVLGVQCGYRYDMLHVGSGVRRIKAIFNMRVMAHEGYRQIGRLHDF